MGRDYSHALMTEVVTRGINTRIAKLVPVINDECDYAFAQDIGSPMSWTEFNAAALIGRILQRTTGKMLFGSQICREEGYLRAAKTLAECTFINGLVMSMLPLGPFRRVLAYPISTYHRMVLQRAVKEVLPAIQARHEKRQVSLGRDPTDGGETDAIDWSFDLVEATTGSTHNSPDRIRLIAVTLLGTMWAGSPATSSLITNMLFQVLLEPLRYLEPLRSEADAAFAAHGFTDAALSAMPLMESFAREVCRLYPVGAVSCARTVTAPGGHRFHDGLELPAGSRIAIPALAIHTDPNNFDDPLSFDGFRFCRPKEAGSDTPSGGAAALSSTNLGFGYGKHACPGRFLAVRNAKLVLAKLLTTYDVKWEGVEIRPPCIALNAQLAANQDQTFLLKKREREV
jgi:cytochrome P450